MRTPRALPVYPWGDNEKLEFGDGADYAIYFDGTNFLIDSGTHEMVIDLATAAVCKIYGGLTASDDLALYANTVQAYPYLILTGGDMTDLHIQATKQFRLYDGADLFGSLRRTNWFHTSNIATGSANTFNWSAKTSTGDIIGIDMDASTNLTMGANLGVTGLKITTKAPNGVGTSNDILLTQGASINNITDGDCYIYGGDGAGDDLNLCANSSDTYPYIELLGAAAPVMHLHSGTNWLIQEQDTTFFTFNRSGSSYLTDVTTGNAMKYSWSAKTSTGNLVVHELDGSTNLTMGVNFGVTGLKIAVKAANGAGESYGIDVSGVPNTETTLKYLNTADAVTATVGTDAPNNWIKCAVGATAYYIPCYTVDGA